MRICLSLLIGTLILVGCAAGPKPVSHVSISPYQPPPPPPQGRIFEGLLQDGEQPGRAVTVGDVAIVPILNPDAPGECGYLTLNEAMQAGLCTVAEKDGVNGLAISNRATQPLFLMVGDLVLGGKQDRIMAESLVVSSGAKDETIPVFCVEHGRWTPEQGNEVSMKQQFYTRKDSEQVDVSVKRAAVTGAGQEGVWNAVGLSNSTLGVAGNTSTGAFRAAFDDADTVARLDRMVKQAGAAKSKDAVGYAVVMQQEVVALDTFDTRGLCEKLTDKLLRSYLLTAITGGYSGAREHPLAARLQDSVTLEAKDAPLSNVVKALNANWSVTILLDLDEDPKVNLSAQDQPMIAVLDSLAGLTGSLVWIGRGSVRFTLEDVSVPAGGGQFDNGSGGIAPYNPISGIFFNNGSGEAVNFNQDVRGRFEHIFDGALGNRLHRNSNLPLLVDTPVIQTFFQQRASVTPDHEYWLERSSRSRDSGGRSEPLPPEELELRRKLEDVQLSLIVESMTLNDVLAKLSAEGDIEIVVDDDVDPEDEVSIDIGRIKLRQALDLVCEPLDLQWVVNGGVVAISASLSADENNAAADQADIAPNAQTRTERKVEGNRVEYTCEDTNRGKTVHRSFVRR